ncbi:MAG: NACHT domain-containing protein [Roseivirga sp.]
MYTHYQRGLSVVLLTSVLLQSCGGNSLLGGYSAPEQRQSLHRAKPREAAPSTPPASVEAPTTPTSASSSPSAYAAAGPLLQPTSLSSQQPPSQGAGPATVKGRALTTAKAERVEFYYADQAWQAAVSSPWLGTEQRLAVRWDQRRSLEGWLESEEAYSKQRIHVYPKEGIVYVGPIGLMGGGNCLSGSSPQPAPPAVALTAQGPPDPPPAAAPPPLSQRPAAESKEELDPPSGPPSPRRVEQEDKATQTEAPTLGILLEAPAPALVPAPEQERPPLLIIQDLMRQRADLQSSAALVKLLNTPQELSEQQLEALRQWLHSYIDWFNQQAQSKDFTPAAIEDYAALARTEVKNTPANRHLLERYWQSLATPLAAQQPGDTPLVEALAHSLQVIDPTVFNGDPSALIQLGSALLARLDPSQATFSQATYPTYRPVLDALHRTLVLIRQIDPRSWSPGQVDGLYQRFQEQLKAVAATSSHYPFEYHSLVLAQSLQRLERRESHLEEHLERAGQGLQGVFHLYQGVRGLVTLNLKASEFQAGYASLSDAFRARRIQAEAWYDWLQALAQASLRSLEDETELATFLEGVEAIKKTPLSDHSARRALRYGVAEQLSLLALESPSERVRSESIAQLEALMGLEAWGSDHEVLVRLQAGLTAAGLSASEKEAKDRAPARPTARPVFEAVAQRLQAEAQETQEALARTPMETAVARTWLKEHYKQQYGKVPTFFENEELAIENMACALRVVGPGGVAGDAISPAALFAARSVRPAEEAQAVKRVLLTGEAGTGKTLLGHSLAYGWAQGDTTFDAVYVLPVRSLQAAKYDGSHYRSEETLATAIAHACFPKLVDEVQFKRLRLQIGEELRRERTLLVLDGLEDWPVASEAIVREAQEAEAPYHLLTTSRSYGVRGERQQASVEVVHAGLGQEEIEAYVGHFFRRAPEQGEALLEVLRGASVLREMASVPVQLSILCALWQDDATGMEEAVRSRSRSSLYRKLARSLWERYARKEGALQNAVMHPKIRTRG